MVLQSDIFLGYNEFPQLLGIETPDVELLQTVVEVLLE